MNTRPERLAHWLFELFEVSPRPPIDLETLAARMGIDQVLDADMGSRTDDSYRAAIEQSSICVVTSTHAVDDSHWPTNSPTGSSLIHRHQPSPTDVLAMVTTKNAFAIRSRPRFSCLMTGRGSLLQSHRI